MSSGINRIVIVGAGQAGATAAFALRRAGFEGEVTVVGAETHLPYERPQLSKDFLLPDATVPELKPFKARADYEAQCIDLMLGRSVVHVDAGDRSLRLDDGQVLPYDRLVIATGVAPRRLGGPIEASGRVLYLRTVEDAGQLRVNIEAGKTLAIIGGGVIGLEVAAAARAHGCDVTVIETRDRLMTRSADELVSAYLDRAHRASGVDIHYGVSAVSLNRDDELKLSDGSVVKAQTVLAGIGVVPNLAGFEHLGISDASGVRVDSNGQTAIPGVYATGDIASQPIGDGHGRVETWANAQDHATAVVQHLLGQAQPRTAPLWFWSDQGNIKLQVIGDPLQGSRVVRGDSRGDAFSIFRLGPDRRVIGCSCVNSHKDMALARRWMKRGTQVHFESLEDPGVPLRECAA